MQVGAWKIVGLREMWTVEAEVKLIHRGPIVTALETILVIFGLGIWLHSALVFKKKKKENLL